MTLALSIAEDALALVLIVLAVLLPLSKHKSGSTWRSTWEKYLPYFGLALLALNLVWIVDDIHVGRSYMGQLVTAAFLAVVVVYALVYNQRKKPTEKHS
jgi:apolipoprotein N-acyltransferase